MTDLELLELRSRLDVLAQSIDFHLTMDKDRIPEKRFEFMSRVRDGLSDVERAIYYLDRRMNILRNELYLRTKDLESTRRHLDMFMETKL